MTDAELPLIWGAAALLSSLTVAALARLRRDRPWLRGVALGGAALALTALVALVQVRAVAAGEVAIATVFDALTLLAVLLAVLLLALSLWVRGPALAAFMMPLTLLTVVLAAALPTQAVPLQAEVPYAATMLHVALTIAGIASLAVGCLCGVMFLLHQRRLRRASTDRLSSRLPNLEWLERQNRRAVAVGFPLLSVGIALGVGLMVQGGGALGLSPGDPKVVSSLVVWLLVAVLAALTFRPRCRGGTVAALTIIAFVLMILVVVGVGLVWPTAHTFGQSASSAGQP